MRGVKRKPLRPSPLPPCSKCLLHHGGPGRRRAPNNPDGCSLCGRLRDGAGHYCKACRAQYQRGHRPRNSELSPEARRRDIARSYVAVYLKRGHIQKLPCVACDAPPEETVAHHHNGHDWPLEVIWVCVPHHLDLHAGRTLNTL